MYKTMLASFQYMGLEMAKVNRKLNALLNQSSFLIFEKYEMCGEAVKLWKDENIDIKKYSDIDQAFSRPCKRCLDGLDDFLAGEKVKSPLFFSTNKNHVDPDIIDKEISEVFEPTRDLFESFFIDEQSTALFALLYPFEKTSMSSDPLYYMRRIGGIELLKLDIQSVTSNYLSIQRVTELANYLLEFSIFYETANNSGEYAPLPLREFLSNEITVKLNKRAQMIRLLMLDIIQYTIMQQSMLSGNLSLNHLYTRLFGYTNNQKEISESIKAIRGNQLLATNFATYLVNKNINFSDTSKVRRIFEEVGNDPSRVDELNKLLLINDFKFEADKMNLFIKFTRSKEEVKILCPFFNVLLEDKMINSPAIYSLLESRYNIYAKLIDLTFTSNIDRTEGTAERLKYWYDFAEE